MRKYHKPAFLALNVFLLLSVVGNIVLLKAARSFYMRIQAVRLDPLGMSTRSFSKFDEVDAQQRLLILGDSRAAEWRIPDGFRNYAIVNGGVNSQTTAQILGRLQEDLDRTKPAKVLLQAGINDLKTLPLFPERRDEIITNCMTNLASIVAHCAEGDRTVILSTIFPVGTPSMARRIVWSPDIAAGVSEVNQFLQSLSATNVIVFDACSLLSGDKGLIMRKYSRDTLHLNDAGYAMLNQELLKLLETSDRHASEPQPTGELNMLGWPVQELSPEREQENHRRALAALDAEIEEQMSELEALRQVAATHAASGHAQELEKRERIVVILKQRLKDEESASQPMDATE